MLDLDLAKRSDADASEINLRMLKAIAEFASKDKDRLSINGVCVEFEARSTTYVATDGVRMACAREEPTQENLLLGRFTIPTHHCKAFKLDKDDEGYTQMFATGARLTVVHGSVDLTFAAIDLEFPHWRRVIPRIMATGVLAQYGFKALDSFRKLAEALDLPAPFLAPNGDGPGLVWFAGIEDVFGLIMPQRTTDQLTKRAPNWATRGGPKYEQADVEDELLKQPAAVTEETGASEQSVRH